MMATLMGTMYATPIAPSGMSIVSAASGPYTSRTQRVESEDRNARGRTDLLALFFPIGERLPQEHIEKRHQSILRMPRT